MPNDLVVGFVTTSRTLTRSPSPAAGTRCPRSPRRLRRPTPSTSRRSLHAAYRIVSSTGTYTYDPTLSSISQLGRRCWSPTRADRRAAPRAPPIHRPGAQHLPASPRPRSASGRPPSTAFPAALRRRARGRRLTQVVSGTSASRRGAGSPLRLALVCSDRRPAPRRAAPAGPRSSGTRTPLPARAARPAPGPAAGARAPHACAAAESGSAASAASSSNHMRRRRLFRRRAPSARTRAPAPPRRSGPAADPVDRVGREHGDAAAARCSARSRRRLRGVNGGR